MTAGPAHAQLRDGGLLPQEESGLITVVGCFLRGGDVRGGPEGKGKYVLAQPRRGPVNSVPTETCTANAGANALELQDTSKFGMNDWMLGRAIEISGRLEKETSDDPDNLRELEVRSFRVVPVVPPAPRAAAAPAPAPLSTLQQPTAPPTTERQPTAPAPRDETRAPAATTGAARTTLPKTASGLPAAGWLGVLVIAAALALRSYGLRQRS
jgi:hypothetical protein